MKVLQWKEQNLHILGVISIVIKRIEINYSVSTGGWTRSNRLILQQSIFKLDIRKSSLTGKLNTGTYFIESLCSVCYGKV